MIDTVNHTEDVIGSDSYSIMKANVPYKVYITVYFDGEQLYARDIANGLKVVDFDIEFTDKSGTHVDFGTSQDGSTYAPLMSF